MKFVLSKRGRLILGCTFALGSAAFAWTQVNGGAQAEWKDEVQANTAGASASPEPEDVLPRMDLDAGSKKLSSHLNLMAVEDTLSRQRQSRVDPLSVLVEEDTQGDAVDGALSQQSSVKISAVVAGGGQFSPTPAPQYYSADARSALEGGAGGPGQDTSKTPEKSEVIDDVPVDCDAATKNEKARSDKKPSKACEDGDQDPGQPDKQPGKPDGDKPKPDTKPKPEASVDEPAGIVLFGLGLAAVAAFSRRRKSA